LKATAWLCKHVLNPSKRVSGLFRPSVRPTYELLSETAERTYMFVVGELNKTFLLHSTSHEDLHTFLLAEVTCGKSREYLLRHGCYSYLR
jgi:hypothetical protein